MIFRNLTNLYNINTKRMIAMGEIGTSLKSVIKYLENFAPLSLSEPWDNTGLLIEPQVSVPVKNVLVTNDLTEEVVQEALNLDTQLIISYHPPIFRPIKTITRSSWKERVIGTCVENKIAVFSPHTSWDSVKGGVNDWLASGFDSGDIVPLSPVDGDPTVGQGRLLNLNSPITVCEAIETVKKLTGLPHLKLALGIKSKLDTVINTIGICAGSGSSVLSKFTTDLYLTGEMSHHELLDAIHRNTSVILCNHSDSERGFLKCFATKMNTDFQNCLSVKVSKLDRDPLITV